MADVGENLDSSSSEDEEVLLSLLMLRRRRRRLRAANRKTWVKSWVSRRQTQGACANIVRELNYEDHASQDLVAVSMTDFLIVNQCNVYTVIIWNLMRFSSTNTTGS